MLAFLSSPLGCPTGQHKRNDCMRGQKMLRRVHQPHVEPLPSPLGVLGVGMTAVHGMWQLSGSDTAIEYSMMSLEPVL